MSPSERRDSTFRDEKVQDICRELIVPGQKCLWGWPGPLRHLMGLLSLDSSQLCAGSVLACLSAIDTRNNGLAGEEPHLVKHEVCQIQHVCGRIQSEGGKCGTLKGLVSQQWNLVGGRDLWTGTQEPWD